MSDCSQLHEHLEAWLEGSVPEPLATDLRDHLAQCGECRTVERLLREQRDARAQAPDGAFVHGVMAQTTGSACARVGDRLGSWLDGELDREDEALVAGHVDGCARCESLAHTLRGLGPVLRSMAEADPGANFTADVLMATLPRPSLAGVFFRRARDLARSLVTRPAFPQEAAFVATALLVLLTATPFAPWPQLPARALGLVQEMSIEPPARDEPAPGPVNRAWLAAWQSPPAEIFSRETGEIRRGLVERLRARWDRTGEDAGMLGGHLLDAGRGAVLFDFETIPPLLVQIGCDLERLWEGLRSPDSLPDETCG